MYLGDDAPADIPFGIGYAGYSTWLAWTKDVAAQGGVASTMPDQAGKTYAGLPAVKYPAAVIAAKQLGTPRVWTTGKSFGFYLAPASILSLDTLHAAQVKIAIAEGKAAEGAENVAKTVAGAAFGTLALVAIVAGVGLSLSRKV